MNDKTQTKPEGFEIRIWEALAAADDDLEFLYEEFGRICEEFGMDIAELDDNLSLEQRVHILYLTLAREQSLVGAQAEQIGNLQEIVITLHNRLIGVEKLFPHLGTCEPICQGCGKSFEPDEDGSETDKDGWHFVGEFTTEELIDKIAEDTQMDKSELRELIGEADDE